MGNGNGLDWYVLVHPTEFNEYTSTHFDFILFSIVVVARLTVDFVFIETSSSLTIFDIEKWVLEMQDTPSTKTAKR